MIHAGRMDTRHIGGDKSAGESVLPWRPGPVGVALIMVLVLVSGTALLTRGGAAAARPQTPHAVAFGSQLGSSASSGAPATDSSSNAVEYAAAHASLSSSPSAVKTKTINQPWVLRVLHPSGTGGSTLCDLVKRNGNMVLSRERAQCHHATATRGVRDLRGPASANGHRKVKGGASVDGFQRGQFLASRDRCFLPAIPARRQPMDVLLVLHAVAAAE